MLRRNWFILLAEILLIVISGKPKILFKQRKIRHDNAKHPRLSSSSKRQSHLQQTGPIRGSSARRLGELLWRQHSQRKVCTVSCEVLQADGRYHPGADLRLRGLNQVRERRHWRGRRGNLYTRNVQLPGQTLSSC